MAKNFPAQRRQEVLSLLQAVLEPAEAVEIHFKEHLKGHTDVTGNHLLMLQQKRAAVEAGPFPQNSVPRRRAQHTTRKTAGF